MKRTMFLLYGVLAYAAFLGTTLYAVGFVGGVLVPRSVDSGGPIAPLGTALPVDAALLLLFGVQHSAMARKGFKDVWTRVVPRPIERSTYVLLSSGCLALLFLLWHPIPRAVWSVENVAGRIALFSLSGVGWLVALLSTFLINHFELFGLRQVYLAARRNEIPATRFRTPWFYRWVRHPLYLGFIIAFWATPTMTVGHLAFALGMLGYILVAIHLEERDLIRDFGARYLAYREQVRGLVPIPRQLPERSADLRARAD
jgi:protein-S-isoprenylcysteine O-methyltransferase Ste14